MTETPQGSDVETRERTLVAASEVSWALRQVNRAAAEVDVELARRLHLRLLDTMALGHVMTADEALGPAQLSARLGISSGSGTELVDRLERAGHLRRERDAHDRRRVRLSVSPDAVQSLLAELAPVFGALDDLAEDFTPEEQQTIIRYLRAAAAHLQRFVQG